jgi:hypothetical protein
MRRIARLDGRSAEDSPSIPPASHALEAAPAEADHEEGQRAGLATRMSRSGSSVAS